MTDPCFATGYRRTANYWRKAAAKLKAEASPRSKPLAEKMAAKMAAKWEERAYQFDMDADEIEAANRVGASDEA